MQYHCNDPELSTIWFDQKRKHFRNLARLFILGFLTTNASITIWPVISQRLRDAGWSALSIWPPFDGWTQLKNWNLSLPQLFLSLRWYIDLAFFAWMELRIYTSRDGSLLWMHIIYEVVNGDDVFWCLQYTDKYYTEVYFRITRLTTVSSIYSHCCDLL